MGQYYRVLEENNGELIVYNRNIIVDGKEEYMMAKLLEHSWWYNYFVNAICEKLYNNEKPSRIIWMGDYADDYANDLEGDHNGLSEETIKAYHKICWGDDEKTIAVPSTEFTLKDKFLVNHTKREYITCSEYFDENVSNDGWCIHPLPLLTCIGNGYGGGDYRFPSPDSTYDIVGIWAWDEISVEDESPTEDYAEIFPIFKEEGWN